MFGKSCIKFDEDLTNPQELSQVTMGALSPKIKTASKYLMVFFWGSSFLVELVRGRWFSLGFLS